MRIDVYLVALTFSLLEVLSSKYQCHTPDVILTSVTTDDSIARFPRRVANSARKPASSVIKLRHHSPEFVLRMISRISSDKIDELYLDSNGLTNLPRALADLSHVVSVSLADNKITDVSNISVVNGLPRLRSLALSRNPLRSLAGLRTDSLVTLQADHCDIQTIDDIKLDSLSGLRTLNLTGNPLGTVCELSSSSLTELVLKNCQLYYLYSETFRGLTNLAYLDVENNKLRAMPDTIFLNNRNLRHLNLRKNLLRVVRNSWFNNTVNLKTLNLATNNISSIEGTNFASLVALAELDLAENKITALPDLETAARDVNFSMNSIGTRGSWDLSGMTRIRRLDMSHNRLEGNCGAFASSSLGILILGHNKLTTLGKDCFARLPNLSDINLRGNRITAGIQPTIFRDNPNLVNVELDDNPWHCNCTELYPLYVYLASGQRTKTSRLICDSPKNATGRTWWEFCGQNWQQLMVVDDRAERTNTWIITISSAFGCCVIFGTMMYITYTFKKNRPAQSRDLIITS